MPPEKTPPKSPPLPEGSPVGQKPAPQSGKALARNQRLKAALRSNLRRRKDQLREKD